MYITKTITLEEIIAAKPKQIWYAARTCWWTHDPAHIGTLPPDKYNRTGRGLPCDPRGSVLFMTSLETKQGDDGEWVEVAPGEEAMAFLLKAQENPDFYGKHGLDAFMAAHHLNCHRSQSDPRPWSGESWDEYNDALDRQAEGR